MIKTTRINPLCPFSLICLFLLITISLGGCAKLPMENEAPSAPLLVSDGVYSAGGVEIRVTVDDPDGDMVTLHFVATHSTGTNQDFSWTSFIASGQEESFFLGLTLGQWSIKAQARDELEEDSPITSYDLLVSQP